MIDITHYITLILYVLYQILFQMVFHSKILYESCRLFISVYSGSTVWLNALTNHADY